MDFEMGLPDELLDELLSAYLDGALSGDERARVEQLLDDDSAVADKLADLRDQQDLFRQAAVPVPRLREDFAASVVQAAIDRAQEENLSPSHPLRRAAAGHQVRPAADSVMSNQRLVATIAGLAASLLFITLIVRQFGGGGNEPVQPNRDDSIASLPNSQANPEESLSPIENIDPVTTPDEIDRDTMVASNDADVKPGELTNRPDQGSPLVTPEMKGSSPQPGSIASNVSDDSSSTPGAVESPMVKASSERQAPIRPLNMLLVVEVKQSDAGRASGAFNQALAGVGIELGEEREVNDALARAVAKGAQASTFDGLDSRVVLLESPAKKLDRLVTRLVSDRSGIDGIALSAISAQFDAPLMKSIESVRTLDPTKIRHQGKSVPVITKEEDVLAAWIEQLGDREFASVRDDKQAAQAVGAMAAGVDTGPDQMANILFLVR